MFNVVRKQRELLTYRTLEMMRMRSEQADGLFEFSE